MYLWYVYACVCRRDSPWAYDQELGTNNHSIRESFESATFSSYIFRHVYIHRYVYISIYICSCTHLCLYTYEYMGAHICICIQVCVYICLLLYMYVTIHVYTYIHIDRTCSCCGTSQCLGFRPSDWVVLVPPCKSLVTEFSWYVHHCNQHGLVFESGVFGKFVFESLPILDEFVGAFEHHVQHCT